MRVNVFIVIMTIWNPSIAEKDKPRYIAIADALEADIASGALQNGQKLPTHRDLADSLGVTVGTVTRGYTEAERRGLIRGETGRGTFVAPGPKNGRALTFDREREPDIVDMSLAFPPYSADPDLASALIGLAGSGDIQRLLQYQPSRGLSRHRRVAAKWAGSFSVKASEDDTLICSGAQHALAVIFGTLFQPGDRVLTESLTYPGVKGLASMFNLRLTPVAMDDKGVIPDSLEAESSRDRVKALYVVPTIHNPTTTTIPESRRRRIAEIAAKRDFLIIEDECYGLSLENRPDPLINFAPERTFFILGISKVIAAGLRIAHLIAPKRFVSDLALGITHTVWTSSPITSELTTQWIESGMAEEILRKRRLEAIARNNIVAERFGDLKYRNIPESFFLWLDLPQQWRCDQLERAARERGVFISTADKFSVGAGPIPECVRICVTGPTTRDQVRKGLDTISEILRGSPEWQGVVI
jgi:DNA-binding transcriptional MocR family regulator